MPTEEQETMTEARALDASRLIDKLDAARWVELYADDLVAGYLREVRAKRRSVRGDAGPALIKMAQAIADSASALLGAHREVLSRALAKYEAKIGAGDVSKGRRAVGRNMKTTARNVEAGAELYADLKKVIDAKIEPRGGGFEVDGKGRKARKEIEKMFDSLREMNDRGKGAPGNVIDKPWLDEPQLTPEVREALRLKLEKLMAQEQRAGGSEAEEEAVVPGEFRESLREEGERARREIETKLQELREIADKSRKKPPGPIDKSCFEGVGLSPEAREILRKEFKKLVVRGQAVPKKPDRPKQETPEAAAIEPKNDPEGEPN